MAISQGDIIRSRWGSLPLYRVLDFYPHPSPYVWARLVTSHRFLKAGQDKLLSKDDYVVEPEPEAWAEKHGLTFEPNASKRS